MHDVLRFVAFGNSCEKIHESKFILNIWKKIKFSLDLTIFITFLYIFKATKTLASPELHNFATILQFWTWISFLRGFKHLYYELTVVYPVARNAHHHSLFATEVKNCPRKSVEASTFAKNCRHSALLLVAAPYTVPLRTSQVCYRLP